jgi:predicted secreted protein
MCRAAMRLLIAQPGSSDDDESDEEAPQQPLDRLHLHTNCYILGALEHLTDTQLQLPAVKTDITLRLPANPDARPTALPYVVEEPESESETQAEPEPEPLSESEAEAERPTTTLPYTVKEPRRITPTLISRPMQPTTMAPAQMYQSLTTMTPHAALQALEITPGLRQVVPAWRKQRMELMEEASDLKQDFIDEAFDPTYLLFQYCICADPVKQTEEAVRRKHHSLAAVASTSGLRPQKKPMKKTCHALKLPPADQCKNCQNPKGKRKCLRPE